MRSKMRTTARGISRAAAVGVGAVALVLSTAACTGGAEPDESTGTSAEGTGDGQDAGSASKSTPAPSDGGGESSSSPFSDEELEPASQRFVDVLQVLDDRDWEAACAMVLDPSTGTSPEGERLQECVDGAEPALDAQAGTLQPGMFDAVDTSMIEASDNGDDTVSLSLLGEDLGIPMVPGDDGRWYLVIPF